LSKLSFPFSITNNFTNFYDALISHSDSKNNQEMFEKKIQDYIASKNATISDENKKDAVWTESVDFAYKSLNFISSAVQPEMDFNEATRRLTIDPILLALCHYNRCFLKLEIDFDFKLENRIGNGPLDYLFGPIAIHTAVKTENSDENDHDDNNNEYTDLLDVEAKTKCDLNNFCQLAAQIHDVMIAKADYNISEQREDLLSQQQQKKMKKDNNEYKKSITTTTKQKNCAFGVLCTGNSWQFYGISNRNVNYNNSNVNNNNNINNNNNNNEKPLIKLLGVFILRVLRYDEKTTRTTGVIDDSNLIGATGEFDSLNVVKRDNVELIMAALQVLNEMSF
jgi:hypothetical protein